jgi:beta-glucosidase
MASTLPQFSWGVGIEDAFIPQARPGMRPLDEYELTGHYRLWREDFDLLRKVGAQHVRWGVPWYRVNPAPGLFDWSWTDQALDYLVNKVGCIPIIDLMHYGTPFWLDNAFINSSYPQRVAEYAAAFAERYRGLVRYYTPLNEPMVNALICGKLGQWPPHLEGDDGYVKVLIPVCRGVALTEKVLRAADPDAVIVQVEAVEHHYTTEAQLGSRVEEETAHIYLPFDLFTGRVSKQHILLPFLSRHGVSDADLQWFSDHLIEVDIIGVNFYAVSGGEWRLGDDNAPAFTRGVTAEHLRETLLKTWDRYHLPLMLTETAWVGTIAERIDWMDRSVAVVRGVMAEGVQVLGYTWWPLFDMVDWDYRLEGGPLHRYTLSSGLYANKFKNIEHLLTYSARHGAWQSRMGDPSSLTRERTPLADHFRRYATGEL